MLPNDSKARRQDAIAKAKEQLQTQINDHFQPVDPEDKPVPYSDGLFKDAAIQWLIETDQASNIVNSWCNTIF